MAGSATVGTAVIKLSFDGKGIKADLDGVSKTAKEYGTKSGSTFGNALTVAAGSLISKGISKALSVVTNQIDDAVNRADTLNRFPKVMEMMGYSAESAADAIGKLRDGVQGIPTSLADVVSGTQRLAAITGNVDKASDWALAISDAMLITTGNVTDASRATEQFIQILSRGKPRGDDWNTIMEIASPIMNELARSLGYAGAELGGDFYEALQKGTLSTEDMMVALVELDKKGGNGLESLHTRVKTATGGIGATITNLQQSISNAIVSMIQDIGSENIEKIIMGVRDALVGLVNVAKNVINFVIENWSVIGPIVGVLGTVAGIIIGINTALKAYHKIQTAVNAVQKVFGKGLNTISTGISKVTSVFNKSPIGGGAEKVGNIFTKLADTIKNAVAKIGEIMTTLVNSLVDPLKAALKGIGEALAGFFQALASPAVLMGAVSFAAVAAAIAAAIWLIGSAVGAIMPVLTDLFNNIIMPIAQFIADTLMSLIENLTNAVILLTQGALIPLGEFLTNAFVQILTTVADVISNVTNGALVPLINTLSGAFTDVIRTVSDLINGVLNAALSGIAEVIRAVGEGFLMMGQSIKLALEGVQGVLQAFAALITAIAAAAVAIVALVTGHSINYGDNYAHLFSKGGKVEGPGTSTSDSIPAMLSDGEYVINAKSAQAIGYDNLDRMNEGDYYSFAGLASDFADDYSTTPTTSGGITVYMTNQINNEMDAEDIGRVMMQSIRRAA